MQRSVSGIDIILSFMNTQFNNRSWRMGVLGGERSTWIEVERSQMINSHGGRKCECACGVGLEWGQRVIFFQINE